VPVSGAALGTEQVIPVVYFVYMWAFNPNGFLADINTAVYDNPAAAGFYFECF